MVRQDLRARPSGEGQGAALDLRAITTTEQKAKKQPPAGDTNQDHKIEVEIREIMRIFPRDLDRFKKDFEDFCQKWE